MDTYILRQNSSPPLVTAHFPYNYSTGAKQFAATDKNRLTTETVNPLSVSHLTERNLVRFLLTNSPNQLFMHTMSNVNFANCHLHPTTVEKVSLNHNLSNNNHHHNHHLT